MSTIQRLLRKLTNGAALRQDRADTTPAAHLADYARVDAPHRARPAIQMGVTPRYRPRPLTCLADAAEVELGGRSRFAAELPSDYWQRTMLRKWWEWDYLAKSAEELGVLHSGSVGVGLGVGMEPLSFYFANSCRKIIATDLYSSETIWHEARFERIEEVYRSSPIPFPRERVEIRNADMRSLGIPDASADFAWSCSSIEHVPTLPDLLKVFDELARVLKIGGHALLTTEFCLGQPPYLLPGMNAWDSELFQCWTEALGAFELVGATDLSYNFCHPANSPRARNHWPAWVDGETPLPLDAAFRHGQTALMVGLSAIAPIALVLRRRKGRNATWAEMGISDSIRAYSEAAGAVQERRVSGVVERLRPWIERGPEGQSLQFYHHLFRVYLEAMIHDCTCGQQDMLREITRFMRHLPSGQVQDADCLDLVAYVLGEAGQHDESAHVFRLAMRSPSATQEHAVSLAVRYYHAMKQRGRQREALDEVADVLVKLAVGGMPPNEFDWAVRSGQSLKPLSTEDAAAWRDALAGQMAPQARKFQSSLARYLGPFHRQSEAGRATRRLAFSRGQLQQRVARWWQGRRAA